MGESFQVYTGIPFFFTSPDILFVKRVNLLRYWGWGGGGGGWRGVGRGRKGGVGRPPDDLKGSAIHATGIPCKKIKLQSVVSAPESLAVTPVYC